MNQELDSEEQAVNWEHTLSQLMSFVSRAYALKDHPGESDQTTLNSCLITSEDNKDEDWHNHMGGRGQMRKHERARK